MAITSSAKKAIRVAARKRLFNVRRQNAIASAKKNIQRLVKENKVAEARKLLPKAYQVIDKAAKTHYIKPNAAARMKSRITRLINRNSKK